MRFDGAGMAQVKTLQRQSGFTLIEVLIALVIAAIALAALSRSFGVTTHNQSLLEEKVVATWVAQNALTQQQIQTGSNQFSREEKMLGRDWLLTQKIEATQLAQFKKLTIEVKPNTASTGGDSSVSARLVTVVGVP